MQGRRQDFTKGVSIGSRSKMWGLGVQPPEADE